MKMQNRSCKNVLLQLYLENLYCSHSRMSVFLLCDIFYLLCVGMALFLKNVAFHGILLDALFETGNHEWKEVYQLLQEGVLRGVVQPLKTTVFERNQVEEAFRYMAQGKHIGKVVLQVSFNMMIIAPTEPT